MDTLWAFQKTQAIKAAIQLKIFTRIAEGARSAGAIASACHASERGTRILCDFLTINGFLVKTDGEYALTPDSAVFLDEHSPAYMGRVANFLTHPAIVEAFHDLAAVVRTGTTLLDGAGTVEPENPVWVEFAEDMVPMMMPMAEMGASLLRPESAETWKVLDLAAGHGMFGITLARYNPNAEIHALDWAPVLAVAEQNAERAGVSSRFHKIAGNAFDVSFGAGYDLVLVTNFLHHFDVPACEQLMKKVRAALNPGGRAAILEFVPNEDRVSPPMPAGFALAMLASTATGDAYTYRELDAMCRNAGFAGTELHRHPAAPGSWVVAST